MTDTGEKTALYTVHEDLGASFTNFGGWLMPLKYGSELTEHRAVRQEAGIFDLSHMGEVRIRGNRAAEFMDFALVTKYSAMSVGKAKYGVIVTETGHIMDDVISYRLAEDEYLIVPNAANAPTVAEALRVRAADFAEVEVIDETDSTALIAVQGPESARIVTQAAGGAAGVAASSDSAGAAEQVIAELRYYAWAGLDIAGHRIICARTGYTGEDGFELYVRLGDSAAANEEPVTGTGDSATANPAVEVWNHLLASASELGVDLHPCGLAARDSLRLEAAMPLYGQELTVDTTPVDAGMGKMVTNALKNKGTFFAREALETIAGTAPHRVLTGLISGERRAARPGATITDGAGTEIGVVTSGQPSPTLGYPIALASVDKDAREPGTVVHVDIRGKTYDYTVVELPFYTRQK